MKFPNHILLDTSKLNVANSSQYWIFDYFLNFHQNPAFYGNVLSHKKFFMKKEKTMPNQLVKNQKKFTLKYSETNLANFLTPAEKKLYKSLFSTRVKVKHRVLLSRHYGKEAYDYLFKKQSVFAIKSLNRLINKFTINPKLTEYKSTYLWDVFDINFLRKEKIYTKLKYSRVPQYDIVSGGVAALFSGFLGFLICEKFGFELLDSGDFYFLFMYLVFFCFFFRLILKISSGVQAEWNFLSYKWLINFYKNISKLFVRSIFSLVWIYKQKK